MNPKVPHKIIIFKLAGIHLISHQKVWYLTASCKVNSAETYNLPQGHYLGAVAQKICIKWFHVPSNIK
jgi:hypothetical protein